jgi:predicted metalloprotease with PDZ domain
MSTSLPRTATRLTPALCVAALLVAAAAAPAVHANPGPAYLGVQLQALDESLMESFGLNESQHGVLVSGVEDDSPADKMGLLRGDVITAIGAERVREPQELRDAIGKLEPETKVTVKYIRKGKPGKVEVVLAERPESDAVRVLRRTREPGDHGTRMIFSGTPMLGVQVQEVTPNLGRYFGVNSGLLVLSVQEDSPAQEAGIQEGDVILLVAGESVKDLSDLREALSEQEDGDKVDVTVMRDRKMATLPVEISSEFSGAFDLSELPNMRWFGHGGEGDDAEVWNDHMRESLRGLEHLKRLPEAQIYRLDGGDQEEMRSQLRSLESELKELREELQQLRRERERG